jgi:hypothetical protein
MPTPFLNDYEMKLQLKTQISEGKTRAVLDTLQQKTAALSDKDLLNEVIQTAARFEDFERARRLNHLSTDEAQRSLAQINYTLLEIIDRLPEEGPSVGQKATPQYNAGKSGFEFRKYWVPIVAGLIGIIAFVVWQNSGTTSQTFSQTVLVQGKDGTPILDNQGKVLIRSPFGLDSMTIGSNGEATFNNLPIALLKEKVKLSISHPQPYQATDLQKEYTLQMHQPITLTVALKYTDRITGDVTDFGNEKPLAGVRVSIRNIETFTDAHGWFELILPDSVQQKLQRVVFEKQGYKRQAIDDVPVHTRQEFHLSLEKQ